MEEKKDIEIDRVHTYELEEVINFSFTKKTISLFYRNDKYLWIYIDLWTTKEELIQMINLIKEDIYWKPIQDIKLILENIDLVIENNKIFNKTETYRFNEYIINNLIK